MKSFCQFKLSLLESTFLEEGVHDPAIFKAIFLAGGPGSGKSFIVGQTALTAHGFKILSSDQHFEHAMKKAEQEMTPEFISSPAGQKMRQIAKARTAIRDERYIKGRLGIVYDGTGQNVDKIINASNRLRALGYETAMLFVNTDLDTAQARNLSRPRSLEPEIVTRAWNDAQRNLKPYKKHFKSNFMIVSNNKENEGSNAEIMKGYRWAAKFAKSPIKNPTAKKWIEMELASEQVELDEKMTADQKKTAKSLIRLGDKPRQAVKTAKKEKPKDKEFYRKAYESTDLEEKSVSQAQQKLMGMALAHKRGEMDDASDEVKKLANSMSEKDLEDFAKTKHKGLPVAKEKYLAAAYKKMKERGA